MRPVILILASGQGARYRAAGGTSHKLQAELGGRTVLQATLEAAAASGLPWHLEQRPHAGMGDALAAAVARQAEAGGWLILPGDMPLVLPDTIRAVALALEQGAAAAQPLVAGRRGHPVGFAARHREALMALTGDEGARRLLAALRDAGRVAELPCRDRGALEDIDTPADLQRARALLQERQQA